MAFTSACSVGMWAATPDCLVFFLCLSARHIEEAFGSWFLGSPASELSPAKKAPDKKTTSLSGHHYLSAQLFPERFLEAFLIGNLTAVRRWEWSCVVTEQPALFPALQQPWSGRQGAELAVRLVRLTARCLSHKHPDTYTR